VIELAFISPAKVDDATTEHKFGELVPKFIKVEDAK
jgi:hypothetical protein